MTTVADIMTRDVLVFPPDANVEDASGALVEHGFGGAPVVDAEGKLLGMFSDSDILLEESRLHLPTVIQILGAQLTWPPSVHRYEEELKKAVSATVSDAMNAEPPVVDETATLEDVATLLHDEQVRQVPVVRDGKVIGIVSRRDVLRAMLGRS